MKKLFDLVVIATFMLHSAAAQLIFEPHTIVGGEYYINPNCAYPIDLDDDDDIDIIVTGETKITWFENDGNENYIPHSIVHGSYYLLNTGYSGFVSVVDFDNDGDKDFICTANSESFDTEVIWFENDGDENFSRHLIISFQDFIGYINKVFAVDLDRDSNIDIVSATNHGLFWYKNDGNENFTQQIFFEDLSFSGKICANDFDGDGDSDIIGQVNGDICLFENGGNENFTQISISDTNDFVNGLDIEDFDLDGDKDIIVLYRFKIIWFENLDNQSFMGHSLISRPIFNYSPIIANDIDNDEDNDIIVVVNNFMDTSLIWYENTGDSTFIEHIIEKEYEGVRSLYATDINEDGYIDLVVVFHRGDNVVWYEYDGNGNFLRHIICPKLYYPDMILSFDIDNDGDNDIISGGGDSYNPNGSEGVITFHENDGNMNFISRRVAQKSCPYLWIYSEDMDGDEDDDIFAAGHRFLCSGAISWNENDDEGNYPVHDITRDWFSYLGDVDNDGDPDIITHDPVFIPAPTTMIYNINIYLYENDGSGNFDIRRIDSIYCDYDNQKNGFYDIYGKDLDSDGDIDLIAIVNNNMLAYKNDNKEFTRYYVDYIYDFQYINFTDVDQDGDIDILGEKNVTKIVWYENVNFNFIYHEIKTIGEFVKLQTVDLDQDGDEDIVAVFDDRFEWYENDSINSFTEHSIATLSDMASFINIVDIDNDNNNDIILIDKGELLGFKNDGNEIFIPTTIADGEYGISSLITQDFDKDGDTDIILSSDIDQKISWYENKLIETDILLSNEKQTDFFNYPNPFSNNTTVSYQLEESGYTQIDIYSLTGQKVATLVSEQKQVGTYEVVWDASDFSSGVYLCKCTHGESFKIKKLILIE